MPKSLMLLGLLALFAAIAAAACSSSEEENTAGSPTTTASAQTVTIKQEDFFFDPKTITAQAGKPLTIKIQNQGTTAHTFTIDELKVDDTLAPGNEEQITITPMQAGTLTFYCRFHRQSNNMEGTLKVTGAAGATAAPSGAASPTATTSSGYGSGYSY